MPIPPCLNPKWIISGYLTLQAAGVAAWWCLLLTCPNSIEWFQPQAWPHAALLSFIGADGALLVGGSLVAASAVARDQPWASTAVWGLAAVVWYPTLYCIGVSARTDQAWLASALMIAMAGLMLAMATIQGYGNQSPAAIRVTPMAKTTAMFWTLIQIVIFWSAFLWILPRGIVELEQRMGWPAFSHAFQFAGSLSLFAIASAGGLWGGLTMARRGAGTPLPTATAPQLVSSGPYGFVRNPMAITGAMQGIAVGWFLGSYAVIACSIGCALLWHFAVRPIEEADLLERFGERYALYQQQVGLWWPRFPAVPLT
jgi:protein-S-isoprenylcysteine O-methyltransferase Ste14